MICPACHSAQCRRSKRRGVRDHLFAVLALKPWRCQSCETRFRGGSVAAAHVFYAHCARCGNLELRRIPRALVVHGWLVGLRRWLRFPAYRCEPCRARFFSLRICHPITPTLCDAERETSSSNEPAEAAGGSVRLP